MKKLLATILLLTSFSANACLDTMPNCEEWDDPFFEQEDKQLHMKYSAVGAHVLMGLGYTDTQAFWTMMMIGALKEMTDNNSFAGHGRDMVANALGASTVFVWRIEF